MGAKDIPSGDSEPETAQWLGSEQSSSTEGASQNPRETDQDPSTPPLERDKADHQPLTEEDDPPTTFAEITQFTQQAQPYFADRDYYKKVLAGGGEDATAFHACLAKLLKSSSPQDKGIYRQQIISRYWQLWRAVAPTMARSTPLLQKHLLFRFGLVLPNLLTKRQRVMLSQIIFQNVHDEPIHYIDEWLIQIAHGRVSPLASDDLKGSARDPLHKIKGQLEKSKAKQEEEKVAIRNNLRDRTRLEKSLSAHAATLNNKRSSPTYPDLSLSYSEDQRKKLSDISQVIKDLLRLDRDISSSHTRLNKAHAQLQTLSASMKKEGDLGTAVSPDLLAKETESIQQLAKMCVSRRGNHLPLLMGQYLGNLDTISTRENVMRVMARVEEIDPYIFMRASKRQKNRIVPHTILVPCYGQSGVCWEPFERVSKATSRGRIAIPLFPNKSVDQVVIAALGDLRWQVAKEQAHHYWMEEGLTGRYYQWFESQKLKGDVRLFFIEDYKLWITKESEGVQQLDREVRGIFWRNVPFPQELREKLKMRGFVYSELYKKDASRASSEGY